MYDNDVSGYIMPSSSTDTAGRTGWNHYSIVYNSNALGEELNKNKEGEEQMSSIFQIFVVNPKTGGKKNNR